MALDFDIIFQIVAIALCTALILFRCAYRAIFRCHIHKTCHRHWRRDDTIMAFALLPLAGRAATIMSSYVLDPAQSMLPVSPQEADSAGLSLEEMTSDRVIARKLLLPGRIFYALFLWCLKLCLLAFYTPFISTFDWGKRAIDITWWSIVVTLVAVVIATLAECRPLHLAWDLAPAAERPVCAKGTGNLLTMAICNIITDLMLLVLPFPVFKTLRLQKKDKIQLYILFSIGIIVVIITILRLPLIFIERLSQRSRSLWANIEILGACIVANAAFFYAFSRDLQRRHLSYSQNSNTTPDTELYLRRISTHSLTPQAHITSSKSSCTGKAGAAELEGLDSNDIGESSKSGGDRTRSGS